MKELKFISPELDYTLRTLFRDILKIASPDVKLSEAGISLGYSENWFLHMPRFSFLEGRRPLAPNHMVMKKLDAQLKDLLGEETLPLLNGSCTASDGRLVSFNDDGNVASINFDILGSTFYILTRMEEIGSGTLDGHGRFPAYASHAYKNGYLHRPVVDEYAEIIWYCIKRLWPNLQREERNFEMKLTHDVDEPFEALFRPVWKMARSFASDIIRRKDIKRAVHRAYLWTKVKRGDWHSDRVYTFDRLMDLGESVGCRDAFYFIPDCSGRMSGDYRIEHPAVRKLIRHINRRGHEIGYHGSYETYLDHSKVKKEVALLKKMAIEEGVEQDFWGGRQHYLRWSAPQTWRSYAEAGLDYDTTLSFADAAGFRCGTCHPYRVFDEERRQELPLTEFPLTVMECSVLGKSYMGYTYERAYEYMMLLKNQCRKYGGTFVLLWHNSAFDDERDWDLYKSVIMG